MESSGGFCPTCSCLGKKVPLLKIKSAVGSIEVCRVNSEEKNIEDSQTVRDFLDELFDTNSLPQNSIPLCSTASPSEIVQNNPNLPFNLISTSRHNAEQHSSSDNFFSSNCMLPRYLADDMKRFVNEDHRNQLPRFSTSLHRDDLLRRKHDRSCDSGISINSFPSSSSTHLSYTEYVSQRTHQGGIASSSDVGSVHKTKPSTDKCVGHLDRMVKLHEQRMKLR